MAGAFGWVEGRRASWALLAAVCCAGWSGLAGAQMRARPMAYPGVDAQGSVTTLQAALRTMAEQADVVFLGTVESVTRVSGEPRGGGFGGSDSVEVRFRVEQAVRGVSGASYMMREWGGLWTGGERRYLVGERRLMLLHRPSALGLSSPVAGMEGAIPVRGNGARVSKASVTTAKAQGNADLRWIAAKLVRPVRYGATDQVGVGTGLPAAEQELNVRAVQGRAMAEGESAPSLVHGVVTRPVGIGVAAQSTGVTGGVAVGAAVAMPVADLLVWLRAWQAAEERGVR